jgi:hypothetical protein
MTANGAEPGTQAAADLGVPYLRMIGDRSAIIGQAEEP